MNTKHDLLTKGEINKFKLRSSLLKLIETYTASMGILRKQLRVLDWGCGRGACVAKLLEMGIDAYGVDVDFQTILNGYPLFDSHGMQPEKRLFCISEDCRTNFEDKYFHIIVSDQVFEHVKHLECLLDEISRISSTNSFGLHNFPAKWRIYEPHLFIPGLHWLPKNYSRFLYLKLMNNKLPDWENTRNKNSEIRTNIFYNYSINKTYYRTLKGICRAFYKRGFNTKFNSTSSPNRLLKIIFPFLIFNNYFSKIFMIWFSKNFKEVELCTSRIEKYGKRI